MIRPCRPAGGCREGPDGGCVSYTGTGIDSSVVRGRALHDVPCTRQFVYSLHLACR